MQPGANKPFHVIFTSVIMGLLIFGFIRFAVNTKQSAKEVNNRELDLRSAQTQRLDQALGLAQTQSQWLPSGQESRYLAIFGFNALGLNDYNQRHFSFPPE